MKGLAVAGAFLTRVPIPVGVVGPGDLARSVPWFPVIGSAVGAVIGCGYWVASLALGSLPAAVVAVAAGLLLTGAFHEDGLADFFDGLGGLDRETSLKAMRDSRLGTFGSAALVIGIVLRVTLISELEPRAAISLIAGVHAWSRGVAVAGLLGPGVGVAGLGESYLGAAKPIHIWGGLTIAGLLGGVLIGAGFWLVAVVGLVGGAAVMRSSRRRIGGVTGDVLGAIQQVAELLGLLVVVGAWT